MMKRAANDRRNDTTLRLSLTALRKLRRALSCAAALSERGADAGDALNRLVADARLIEADAALAAESGVKRLPGRHRTPDIYILIQKLLCGGERALTREAMMDALRGEGLTQRELWAVPEALRVAMAESAAAVAREVVRDARACVNAARFVRRPLFAPRGAAPAFYAHALMLCGEAGLARPRRTLEATLRRMGSAPDAVVRAANEARARQRVRLENLAATRRMLDALDWQKCFEELSELHAELRRDPAGVYPLMDAASRQRVRDQAERIARATGLTETAAAEAAVAAAREQTGPTARSLDELAAKPIDPKRSVCWWLCDDAGRRELLKRVGSPRARLPKLAPDPKGRAVMGCIVALAAGIAAALGAWLGHGWLAPLLLPAAWAAADSVVACLFPHFVPPAALLKLHVERLPDPWRTLVVTPVLIPDAERAGAMCDNLEVLGCMETDPNLSFLLLADYADAGLPEQPGDAAIARVLEERIAGMNRRAGREKYHWLIRPRTLLEADKRWMGRDRKRGALMDLNRLLLGGESAFTTSGAALARGFRWVLTLDADTRMLPGTVHKLVGAAAHPLNGRFAVFQPRMDVAPSACANRFARLFFGPGGLDHYPAAASSLWMDLTGAGVFGGKGLYDVAAFHRALDGALPEGRILSHDLIEGALAGTAFLGDVSLCDGCPATLNGWARRLHRWTRGDWQLLPLMLDPKRPLAAADRFRMLDNLMRSLKAPALMGLYACAALSGSGDALAAALLLNFLDPLLRPADRQGPLRALMEVAILPFSAALSLDAVVRTLWRLFVSGRRLLEWVPSADADRGGRGLNRFNRLAAILTLTGLRHPNAIPMALGLFALFWTGADWVRDMADEPVEESLSDSYADGLRELARDTWRFFAECDGPLPPDNVQLDPLAEPARRASPTNVGLYLLSCAAARHLGFIDAAERDRRVAAALDALDRAEKWRGHPFNWFDIDTCAALRPRYVSSVDSGNLAACALACANAVDDPALARRLRALAEGMDFRALYDGERRLFRVGVDVDANTPSSSHYDLLASESRLLSYAAMMLGQIPVEHWKHLGRACAPVGREAALLSWSGTLFEYLMPELLTRAPALSLLGGAARAATHAQMSRGAPWGVSESGYNAFDRRMNYQYRAFGLKELALDGDAADGVIAPYASALALAVAPDAAAENLAAMSALGWRDDRGMYEAADYRRPAPDGSPALVKSHMAHHQGMTLCAICNALTGDALVHDFMADPRARALSLLLEERQPCAKRLKRRRPDARRSRRAPKPVQRASRGQVTDAHLLVGSEARALVTGDGAVHYARGPIDATRFGCDLIDRPEAARLYCRIDGAVCAFDGGSVFDAGSARFEAAFGPLRAAMTVSLSPEDDALYRLVTLHNPTAAPVRAEVMDVAPVALARRADMLAHPAFQLLSVEAVPFQEHGLLFSRRLRNPGEKYPKLFHAVETSGEVLRETSLERAIGRDGTPSFNLTGEIRPAPLNPAGALLARLEIAPGETARACFTLKLTDGDAPPGFDPERAAQLGRARAEALLGFMGIPAAQYHRLDRLAALLLDPRLAARAKAANRPAGRAPREALWALGLSGDRPLMCLRVGDATQSAAARAALRAHRFYRAMGLDADLILIDAAPAGYDRPVRRMLENQIDACTLRESVRLLDGLSDNEIETLKRSAAVWLDADSDLAEQARALLERLDPEPPARPLDPGADALPDEPRDLDNGFGGFAADGSYVIDVRPGHATPAPWCHILAGEAFGLLLTERGGGFLWHGNSRSGRLTPWRGDPLRERYDLKLALRRGDTGETLSLLPGERPAMPFRVRYAPGSAKYAFATTRLSGEVRFALSDRAALIDVDLNLNAVRGRGFTVELSADWLMGADVSDACRVAAWRCENAVFATGTMDGVGWLAPEIAPVRSGENRLRFAVGWAEDYAVARADARAFREGGATPVEPAPLRLTFETPDHILNFMLNSFLPHQVLASRVDGRTGYYQPGGAFGFRDQLQDMLALIPNDPGRVRQHLLMCAGRQFAAGDVLHWWHMPYLGVRTRIYDDRLFLPFVAAAYVRQTGDVAALSEAVPYLEDAPIPEGREDLFQAMRPGAETDTLHGHCMRAFDAIRTGAHGLALMGAGDWNDGMNRVGHRGRGESVWLSMFIAACADAYAEICPVAEDARSLRRLAQAHRDAVEAHGWDGGWYRRAYTDDGDILSGADAPACQIDLLPQAWAVLAGLDPRRARRAVDAAWERLVDPAHGVAKLLDPPFDAEGPDPGYIRGYPPGVRENGAQYTHAACWLLLALIRLGDARRAHRLLDMLLPPTHADTPEKAERYRVEPYVMAGDVCALPGVEGRGGWTWYTGSAAWYYVCALELLGYERRGDDVRLNALLGDWPEAALTLRHGGSRFRLACSKEDRAVTLDGVPVDGDFIRMFDDGADHEARFPPRR